MAITIERYKNIDTNGDGNLSDKELEAFAKKESLSADQVAQLKKDGEALQKSLSSSSKSGVAKSGGNESPNPDVETRAGLKKVEQEMNKLVKELRAAKEEKAREQIKVKLQEAVARAEKLNGELLNGKRALKLNGYKKMAGMSTNKNNAKFKASTAGSSKGTSAGAGNAKAASAGAGGAKASSAGGSFAPPANWGAQTAGASFNSSAAYLSSMAIEDDIMSSMDNINKNQNRGEQLMRLFFYFSKMAQSGDMGSMYQFMKFLTYIISKDKAKQQIDMGKKLIQLQDLSRKWTSKLMNLSTDSADPNASNELMKEMTLVKSETDAIATSQKLISQMMEEFAQVVESLTNSTKAALDAYGRILRTVSQSR